MEDMQLVRLYGEVVYACDLGNQMEGAVGIQLTPILAIIHTMLPTRIVTNPEKLLGVGIKLDRTAMKPRWIWCARAVM